MDKQLKELRSMYKKEIPATFSSKDKQKVLTSIKKVSQKRKIKHYLPKLLSTVTLTALIFIGFIIGKDQLQLFEWTNKDEVVQDNKLPNLTALFEEHPNYEVLYDELMVHFKEIYPDQTDHFEESFAEAVIYYLHGMWTEDEQLVNQFLRAPDLPDTIAAVKENMAFYQNVKDADIEVVDVRRSYAEPMVGISIKYEKSDSTITRVLLLESYDHDHITFHDSAETRLWATVDEAYTTFDPDSIRPGDIFGNLEVTDVQKQQKQTTVSFKGTITLFGDIENMGQLAFLPNEKSKFEFPFAIEDIGVAVLSFKNDDVIKEMYGLKNWQDVGNQTMNDVVVDVVEIKYIYSPYGLSTIYLGVDESLSADFPTETHETTIELNDELLDIYRQYTDSFDDALLAGLKPIDIFKLYFHAENINDEEVVFALYIQGEMYGTPDKKAYFHDPFYAVDEVMKQNAKEFYLQLQTVETFDVTIWPDEQAIISFFIPTSEWPKQFWLIYDTDTNVWKVSWMAMQ